MSSKVMPAIVLVRGAWHILEHYSEFIQRLQQAGFEIFCPLLPTCGETKRLKADIPANVVMLLHKYGGDVGTEALKELSLNERVSQGLSGGFFHLIFMCTFMLQVGESVGSTNLPRPEPNPVELDEATKTTFLLKLCEPPTELFYPDLEPEHAKKMESLLVRQSGAAMTDMPGSISQLPT